MAIHLITNCTSKKTAKLKSSVSVGQIESQGPLAVQEWVQMLSKENQTLPATEVYLGDHWSRALEVIKNGNKVSIISAGYGLINSNEDVCRYDATFSSGNLNSISRLFPEVCPSQANYQWWCLVNSLRNRNGLVELYASNPTDKFIISTSPGYLRVIEPELIKLVQSKKLSKENTVIFSSKQRLAIQLEPFFFTAKDDFCGQLGGSRISLNIRLAEHIINNLSGTLNFSAQVNNIYDTLTGNAKPAVKYDRKKLDDTAVRDFITSFLGTCGKARPTASPILRELRNNGMACEQKRFHTIFKSVMQTTRQ